MRHNRLGYLIGEGFRSVFTHGFMSFACVAVIVACLLIMGNFAMLAVNINYNIDHLESENEMLAYVDETLSETEARELQAHIRSLPNVSSVEFITREEAMDAFIAKHEGTNFEEVTPSCFRHRYVIYLNDLSQMAETKAQVEAVDGIADTSASLEMSRGFILVRNIVSVISALLIVILFVVSVFIMQNTIKLATFSRREEIAIMKMVGASNFFIRCPFVIEGLILGLLGGAFAFLIQWGIYDFICGRILSSAMSQLVLVIPFETLRYPVLIVFLGVGLVVGTFGSNIAIRNYLKV